jgi:asparagine synthase (glutamine-hydrolysing)
MAAIAGITNPAQRQDVVSWMKKISHRGNGGSKVIEHQNILMQSSWHEIEERPVSDVLKENAVWDGAPPAQITPGALASWAQPFALAAATSKGLFLARDGLGLKPLYYGYKGDNLCFASEVKALLEITTDINEFPPGTWYTLQDGFQTFTQIQTGSTLLDNDTEAMIAELRRRLETAIQRSVVSERMGVWLSGGVDSSVIATLAKRQVKELHSFVIGLPGATDLKYGGIMAEHLGTIHHPVTVTLEDLLPILPDAIYALESFDALLVRSSVTNYLISRFVSEYVDGIFSGEGGDELFAGYDYMKDLPREKLHLELEQATGRLHNTAFQRVDRCATANGIVPFVPFADKDVVDFALSIPTHLKIYRDGEKEIEKWILRKTIDGMIPDSVLWRPKTKFWQGTGLKELISEYAEAQVSDADFKRERALPNGWVLNTKEELMYYRIFKERFGEASELEWMGRTKGAPVQ